MKYTVVVAEDEELLLNNLVQKIQKADPDFQVTGTAQTGEQAFALVEKLTPDLVITDIRMPVMDGLEAARRIRASDHPRAKDIPILALTANGLEEDNKEILDAGMNKRLSKPLSVSLLYESILSYIKGKER